MSGAIGNVLEWYDFAVYGTLAPILGKLFFPSDDPLISLLAAFSVFAVGYISRPLGGVLMGHIGDRYGRKAVMILSVVMMGLGTTAIGLLPTSAQIGIAAPALLIFLRFVQGISVGGEYPSSIVFLAEHSSSHNRAYAASWPLFGSIVGFLIGSGFGAVMSTFLSDASMESWGWRIPFLFGAFIALSGAYFRRHMTEPPYFKKAKPSTKAPIIVAIREYWRPILQIIGLSLVNGVGFYMLWVYAASYLTDRMHVSTANALDINTLSLIAMLPATTLAAILSDRIGRKPLLYFVGLGTLFAAWPLWWLMHHQSFMLILIGQLGFSVLYGVGYAGLSAVMVEIFPTHVRCSASALAYNLSAGLFGGTVPFVATYFVQRTSDDFFPAYYLMAAGLISFLTTLTMKETMGTELPK